MKLPYGRGIAIALLFFSIPTALAAFPDVPSDHPHRLAIDYVFNQGIVRGYPDGNFGPQFNVNRAEFTKFVIASQFSELEINNCDRKAKPFSDIEPTEWYAPYICLAHMKGIVGGYPDGTFSPGSSISLVEASKIIALAFGLEIKEDEKVWYRPHIEALAKLNAIPTDIETYSSVITRGYLASMIYRVRAGVTNLGSHSYLSLGAEIEVPAGGDNTTDNDNYEIEEVSKRAQFVSANYDVRGDVLINGTSLKLENFKTDSGPDLKVFLASDLAANGYVNLGELESFSGDQEYTIPLNTDLKKFNMVLIWCEEFTELFGYAQLR